MIKKIRLQLALLGFLSFNLLNKTCFALDAKLPGIPKPKFKDPITGKDVDPLPGIESTDSTSTEIYYFFTNQFVPFFVKGISGFVGAACIVAIMIGGVQYLIAYGEDEKLQNAKRTIQYALIGLIITILSYSIVSIIGSLPLNPPPPS